jgi:hypothetical protein
LQQPFLANLPLVGRHERLIAGDDLGGRPQDRLAEIVVIRHNRTAVGELHGRAVEPVKRRTAAGLTAPLVTIVAPQVGQQLTAHLGQRGARLAAAEPSLIFGRLQHMNRPAHLGVLGPAILGAKQVILPDLGWLEPDRGIAAG